MAAPVPTTGPAVAAVAAVAAYPTTPPAPICGDTALLAGPAGPPAGAVRVDPGQDLVALTEAQPEGTTFWLAPGTHYLGSGIDDHVEPKAGNTYVGGPGAVVDGQRVNEFAFGGYAPDVTVRYLTVQHFGPVGGGLNEGPVNHEVADGWVIEYNTIRENAGAGVVLGVDNVVRFNCLADNGQYGFIVFEAVNFTLDHNEIAGNDADDWRARDANCGCSGGGKIWDSTGGAVTANWVHHNKNVGIWVDTNDVGIRIEENYVNDNWAEGIMYELSYNGRIAANTLRANAIGKGRAFAAAGISFPVGAVYIAEAGGDARVYGGVYTDFEITGNLLEDNWGGVVVWENADRFCGSPANSSTGFCTKVGAASLSTCVPGTIDDEPYRSDCRWKTQNVLVHDNDFRIDKGAVGCAGSPCGQQALLSNYGTFPDWSPYVGTEIQDAVTYARDNRFSSNRYVGDWHFTPWEAGRILDFASWRASPYNQDAGSTIEVGTRTPSANALDPDTAGMEESAGQWQPWFSTAVTSSTEQAHTGSRSLEVDVTADHGWGIVLRNWPGFFQSAGNKAISFWAMASPGTTTGATMAVHWRTSGGVDLRVDRVAIPALSGTWQQASAVVSAPPGTAAVSLDVTSSGGRPGNTVYLDDVVVADSAVGPVTPDGPPSILDPDTSGREGSVGQWQPWFSTAVSSSSEQARAGNRSLRVDVNAPYGWGVTQQNWPGFPVTPGAKAVSVWGRVGSGIGLTATMQVNWRSATGETLRTDALNLPLGPAWSQAAATLEAPVGTTRVGVDFFNATGGPGDHFYLDDVVVADPPPPANALDRDTAGLEASAGQWQPWFSTAVTSSPDHARTGSRSLRVEVTQPYGWGVTQANWPGFVATPGPKTIRFWGLAPATVGLSATMTVHWRTAAGEELGRQTLDLALGASWAEARADVTAPPGTERVAVDLTNRSDSPGDVIHLDDLGVLDR